MTEPNQNSSTLIIHHVEGVHIVEFTDIAILDQGRIEYIHHELKAMAEKGLPKIILSFEHVQHISSAMLGVLMSLNKQIKKAGGELRLASIGQDIEEVFKITRLDKMLKIYRSTDMAMIKF